MMIDEGADAQTVIYNDMASPIEEQPQQEMVEGTLMRVSQGGLISKIECDIIVVEDVPGDGLAFDQVDKVIQKLHELSSTRGIMLQFGMFETDSGYEEIRERFSKFSQFHEITQIENNFPFRFSDQKLFNKLISSAEVVYEPFSQQVTQTLETLREVVSQDEA